MPFEASWDVFWSLTVCGVEEPKLTQNAVCKSSTMLSSVAEANNS